MPQTFVGDGGNNNLINKADAGIDFLEIVYGLEGDDTLAGGWGGDILDGGEGGEAAGDTVRYDVNSTRTDLFGTGFQGVEVRLANGWAVDQYGFTDNVFNIENIRGTNQALWNDVLVGNTDNNDIRGLAGPDTIYAGQGKDSSFGGPDNDTIVWVFGDGRDAVIDGGAGNNDQIWVFTAFPNPFDGLPAVFGPGDGIEVISGTSGPFEVRGSDLADTWDFSNLTASNFTTINGAAGDDFITGTNRGEVIRGGTGNDALFGGAGGNVQSGPDTIEGEAGNDFIYGYNGNDQLLGGPGEDTLDGWQGSDNMSGGAGVDQFDVWMVDVPSLPPAVSLSLRPKDIVFDFEGGGGVQPGTNDRIIVHSTGGGVTVTQLPAVAGDPFGYFRYQLSDVADPTRVQALDVFSTNGLQPIVGVAGPDILII